jgi:hypothetical protein
MAKIKKCWKCGSGMIPKITINKDSRISECKDCGLRTYRRRNKMKEYKDDNEDNEDIANKVLDRECCKLMEYYDSVLILVTKHDSKTNSSLFNSHKKPVKSIN